MAELILSTPLEHLGNLLIRPYQSVRAIRESEIKRLRNELDLLKRWTELAKKNSTIKEKLSMKLQAAQVWQIAGLIGDILDEYDLASSQDRIDYMRRAGFMIVKLIREGCDVNSIKALLFHICETKVSNEAENDEAVFVSDRDEVLLLLLGRELRLTGVAVFGGVGIGKTALVAKMYHGKAAKAHFKVRVWISVPSGRVNEEDIMWLIVKLLRRDEWKIEAMRWEEIVNSVIWSLTEKRYLLVFDGICDEELLRVVKFLPDNYNGSRVVVTTRSEAVAKQFDRFYKVEPLTDEASWELFCRTAFKDPNKCPKELQEASIDIMKMCKGSPIFIKSLADFMSMKLEDMCEWRKLLGDFSLKGDPCFVAPSNTIIFDYNDLPLHLRVCFMYFSIFPKESPIRNEKLIRLWISEGLVEENQGKTLEEVADECLNELIDRDLVEACEGYYGMNKFCRVNNLMHELVGRMARSNDFCMVDDGTSSGLGGNCRRLIISSDDGVHQAWDTVEEFRAVRSVFLWDTGRLNDYVLSIFFKKYYFLTMLDIENSLLEVLPKEVGYLSSLSYLSLKNTRVRKLPSAIGMLSRLEFLHISGSQPIELPIEIAKLTRLRHLHASHNDNETGLSMDSTKGVKISRGIRGLTNLQTLEVVDANLSGKDVIRELRELKKLRSLKVSRLTSSLSKALCACIKETKHLESLYLQSMRNETLELQTISFPPPRLERLVLKGKLRSLPNWIPRLDNLRAMCLSLSSLAKDPMNRLCHLPNLESLWLYGAYQGPRLTFEAGFKKLKLLVLREMRGLEAVEIAEDTMPLLEELRIGPSPLLDKVPTGVAHLRRLKVLSFYDMPVDFVLRLQPNNGYEFPKIQHVPSVLFHYKFGLGKNYVSYNLGEPELLRCLSEGCFDENTDNVLGRDSRRSFSYSEDEGESTRTSSFRWENVRWSSFKSGQLSFFSDDIED